MALDLIRQNSGFKWQSECILFLRAWLNFFPNREWEIVQRMKEGSFDIGEVSLQLFILFLLVHLSPLLLLLLLLYYYIIIIIIIIILIIILLIFVIILILPLFESISVTLTFRRNLHGGLRVHDAGRDSRAPDVLWPQVVCGPLPWRRFRSRGVASRYPSTRLDSPNLKMALCAPFRCPKFMLNQDSAT
jgi:hypothetical protein